MSEVTQARAKVFLEGRGITDDVQQSLDDLIYSAFESIGSKTVNESTEEVSDERILDETLAEASEVNNLGAEGQVDWLLSNGFDEADIMRKVFFGPEHRKKPKSFSMMDTSTGHLSLYTRKWMQNRTMKARFGIMDREEGFAMSTYLGTDENWREHEDLIPGDLVHVLRYAQANGQDWILFDMDADRDFNLPWYEDIYSKPETSSDEQSALLVMDDASGIWHVDPDGTGIADLRIRASKELEDTDYEIPKGEGVWITIGGTSMRIKDHESDVTVSTFVSGFEMDDPISELIVYQEDVVAARKEILENAPDMDV